MKERTFSITLDIDWAPDFVIDWVAERLAAAGVKATWFVTHSSRAVEDLKRHPGLFELGIHPNFFPNSTQGRTVEQVFDYCMELVPDAVSMRTHGLVQSTPILGRALERTGVRVDASIHLPYGANVHPVAQWFESGRLVRIPYVWEDDFEMIRPQPCWHERALVDACSGAVVLDFHPIHVYLNSATMQPYEALKQRVSSLSKATPAETDGLFHNGAGTLTFFDQVLSYVQTKPTCWISEYEGMCNEADQMKRRVA